MGNDQSSPNDTQPTNSNLSFNINFALNQEKIPIQPTHASISEKQHHKHKDITEHHKHKHKDITDHHKHKDIIDHHKHKDITEQHCKFGNLCKFKDTTCKRQHPSKNNVDLDNLKIQGLKDLCKEHCLDTNRCSSRDDYVKLLHKSGIR